MTPEIAAPLRHVVRVEAIKTRGTPVAVTAGPAERQAVATALGLASVEALEGRYSLSRNGDRVRLEGKIEAALHQTCVVTLEPFPVKLSVPVELDFAPEVESRVAARRGGDAEEIDVEVMLGEADPPEPIVDGTIDLGSVTVEFLSLALDPYPRKPGVAFSEPAPELQEERSPFAALARLGRGEK
ncbi:MAG: metal-binding protein [Chelatococcus sp.]|nr:MAG: metal-binding protein [Chelatococcus sp.]